MPDYRLYCLDGSDKIVSAEWITAHSDDEAIVFARAKKLSIKCELWHRNRRVAEVSPHEG
jgi:hypothetical protein